MADDDRVEKKGHQGVDGVGVKLALLALVRDVPGFAGDGNTVEDREKSVDLVADCGLVGGGGGLWVVVLAGAECTAGTRVLVRD